MFKSFRKSIMNSIRDADRIYEAYKRSRDCSMKNLLKNLIHVKQEQKTDRQQIEELEKRVYQLECNHPKIARELKKGFFYGMCYGYDLICSKCGKVLKDHVVYEKEQKKILKRQLKALDND